MTVTEFDLERAMARVVETFPFKGYFDPTLSAHLTIARTVTRYLPPGSRLLDFGAGAADKTAVLAALGYECTAVDDLADEWHKRGEARQMILDFAKKMNIDYRTGGVNEISVDDEYDMVMLNNVLEEFHDSPRNLLIELLKRVRDGGYLFITVPNHVNLRKRVDVLRGKTNNPRFELFYWYPGDRWRGPVREYTRGDCMALANALGLEVVDLQGIHHMLRRVPRPMLSSYLAVSRLMPWTRDTLLMVARKPAGWVPKPELDEQELRELRELSGLRSWSESGH